MTRVVYGAGGKGGAPDAGDSVISGMGHDSGIEHATSSVLRSVGATGGVRGLWMGVSVRRLELFLGRWRAHRAPTARTADRAFLDDAGMGRSEHHRRTPQAERRAGSARPDGRMGCTAMGAPPASPAVVRRHLD